MKLFHIEGPAPYSTNTFLIISEKEAVVIDPAAFKSQYNDILKNENVKLTHVLLTHGHHDHIACAKSLCKEHGAKLIMHSADNKQFKMNADEEYIDRKPIKIGECEITPIFTPGHTKGSVCLLCGDVMFSGDTLFEGDIGRTDLEGGSDLEIKKSLKLLWDEISDETQVLPGHGPFSTMQREKINNYYLKDSSI